MNCLECAKLRDEIKGLRAAMLHLRGLNERMNRKNIRLTAENNNLRRVGCPAVGGWLNEWEDKNGLSA